MILSRQSILRRLAAPAPGEPVIVTASEFFHGSAGPIVIAPKPAEQQAADNAVKSKEIGNVARSEPAQTQAATPKQRLDAIVDMFRAAVESVTRL